MKDTTKAGVLAVVRRMIARSNENKAIGFLVENNTLHNRAILNADCQPLVQQIEPIDSATGGTAQQRMGDRIKPKSLKIKGLVSLNQTNPPASNQPIMVRVIIASQKDVKVGNNFASTLDMAHLLRPAFAGTGNDQVSFSGTTQDLLYPVNKEKFKVFMDKTIKLTPVVSTGSREQNPGYVGKYSYTFKSLPAALTFDAGNGDWANNFAPFVTIGYAYTDGSTENVNRIAHNCYSLLEFEDS